MGFVLSILYLVTYYLTTPVLFGPLAASRVELILAILIFFVSLPKLTGSIILKTPQSVALVGLAVALMLSVIVGLSWFGGALQAFLGFIPNAFAYLIVCLHCNSVKRLRIVVVMLFSVCLFVIANGCLAFLHGVPGTSSPNMHSLEVAPIPQEAETIPYLFAMRSDTGELFYRLRGLGLINDPNDFGQFLVCVIPLGFVFWRSKKTLSNFVCVVLPVCLLLYGLYLTHSRGTLLALIAIAVVAARRRIGTLPALVLATGVFVATMALHFTGGRDISANAGADRTELWSDGLQLLKSHPLFGVGPGRMPELVDSHKTAHNSLVVCAAELGLFGLYFWSMFLFPTLRDALALTSPENVSESVASEPEATPFPQAARGGVALDKAEVNRLGRLLVLSLTGFLVSGWFLSRALVLTLFLLGGVVEVVYQMALERGMIAPRLRLTRVLLYSGGLAAALVLFMYLTLRILNLMR
jgi:O-antigen ligase